MKDEHVETTEEINMRDNPDEDTTVPILQQLGILAAILLLIFGTGYVPKMLNDLNTQAAATEVVDASEATTITQIIEDNPFEGITVQGEAAFVYDITADQVLYEKNPNKQLPLASVTKLMTALVAHELFTSESEVPITVAALLQDGDSGLLDGEAFSLLDLLQLTLLSSSNDGAFAIATTVGAALAPNGGAATFVEAMNIRANELGLTETYFKNPTGLDISKTEAGAYGSAKDVAVLMEYILAHYPSILEKTTHELAYIPNEDGASHAVENTNPIVTQIDGLIGSKTGYTELAGGNLAIAFDAALNRPVVVVVLGSSRSGRFNDVQRLAVAARDVIQ